MHESPAPAPPETAFEHGITFTPVPLTRTHRGGWTPQRQRDFITALAATGNVNRAAKAVGMTKQSAYNLLKRPDAESFAAAWDAAIFMGYQERLDSVIERARHGVVTPRYYKGKQVGTRHSYDYRLAVTVLDSRAPPPRNKVAR